MAEAMNQDVGDTGGELASIQAAARWLVGASAAVMTVLLAGLQLSTLARTTVDSLSSRVLALSAVIIGLIAVGRVLILATRVLVHPGWTMSKLAQLDSPPAHDWNTHWLRDELGGQRRLLVPGESFRPSDLYDRGHQMLSAFDVLYEDGTVSVGATTFNVANDADTKLLQSRNDNIQAIIKRVVEAANLADARRRYRKLVRSLPIMGTILVIAIGVVVYLGSTVSDTPVTTPIEATITFRADVASSSDVFVPMTCAGRSVSGVAVGGTLRNPVIVIDGPGCTLNQVTLPPNVAVVVLKPGK